MKSKFLALAIATAALNVLAPAIGHAQGFLVNGHAASKAEAQLLVSYGVQKGSWVSTCSSASEECSMINAVHRRVRVRQPMLG